MYPKLLQNSRYVIAIATTIILLLFYTSTSSGLGPSREAPGSSLRSNGIGSLSGGSKQEALSPGGDKNFEDPSLETINSEHNDSENDGGPFTDRGDPVEIYHDLRSLTKPDHKYYTIKMGDVMTTNANLLTHSAERNKWVAVATNVEGWRSRALTCPITLVDGGLVCEQKAQALMASPSLKGTCDNFRDAVKLNSYTGPRDTRVFWGPLAPYVMYASQSQFGCLGLWLHNAQMLLEPFRTPSVNDERSFNTATEIQRPQTVVQTNATIEKNWFLFWDKDNNMYVHYDIWPKRSFAQVQSNGSVGLDLAVTSQSEDTACLAKHMPVLNKDQFVKEQIHQATNSLAITRCKRHDSQCLQSSPGAYIMHIFHRQRINNGHATYQPYVVLFEDKPPFRLHAVGQKALWIHGRDLLTEASQAKKYIGNAHAMPKNHSEMFFITSMSWKTQGQRFSGFLDDPVWISFGREDSLAGSIDVLAADLLTDLATC